MKPLQLLSLCTGIGGIDYVWSHILGQTIVGQVEIDPYCTAILEKHWPDVPRHRDLRELMHDDPFGDADIVAGGIPCQPFSLSGKRRGTQDDRHLWPFAFALIKRRRPCWVLIENVVGFISLVLDLVQTDLESAGYISQAYVLPACAVGAPHIRERVFVVAHTTSCGSQISEEQAWATTKSHASSPLADANSEGRKASWIKQQTTASLQCSENVADTDGNRQWQRTSQSQHQPSCDRTPNTSTDGTQRTLADANSKRWQERNFASSIRDARQSARFVETNRADWQSQSRMGGNSDGFSNWLDSMQWPSPPEQTQQTWEPSRTIPHKIVHRSARLKALGNAVVPQHVYPFLKCILEIERGNR